MISPQSRFSSSPSKNTDGFTAAEVQAVSIPPGASALQPWTPSLDYEEVEFGALQPGPFNLTLMGRVVNIHETPVQSKSPRAAKGCLRIMLADGTGVIAVRLWYAQARYFIRLGQLVTLWTVHISPSSEHNNLAPNSVPLFTSIFPEKERNCHLMVHEHSDDGRIFKRPFGCHGSRALPGLMSLKSFVAGGFDAEQPKLLVCVKSVGLRKKFLTRSGIEGELIPINIFDDTADATLTLFGYLCNSASTFQPSQTIFLIHRPGWCIDTSAKLTLNSDSRIDIDPDVIDAHRLRTLARHQKRKAHINPSFPDVDISTFESASVRALYTLADIDEFARLNPSEKLIGYISVIITELRLVSFSKRNMLMCNECCGTSLFGNALKLNCTHCGKIVELRVNPRVLGPIIDETGSISSGKLILSTPAWQQLFGRTTDQLVSTGEDVLQYLAHRLLFLRATMGFALRLEDGVGRLAVWCVKN